ncbi:MAG: fumarylacetoacetate hydrolase family protein [Alphaproteobacteria bacterium]|nr:fumarylacetoacetate hydrolase family protein [Alphaproteobacteria bacterium]
MKLITFNYKNNQRIGALVDEEIIDLTQADSKLPNDMVRLLDGGSEALEVVRKVIASCKERIPLADVKLCAPIPRARKFLGLGLSYRSHVEEIKNSGLDIVIPDNQVWFNKQVSCITGPYDPIHMPRVSTAFDYEGEMAVVIGKRCRHVPADKGHEVVAGYMVTNDLSVRDWQMRSPTAMLGKSFDTHGPIGPWITCVDEMDRPENLRVQTWIDGEKRQDGNTDDFIYSIGEMIAELTTVFTLEPGDILATGTPSGIGAASKPQRFLKIGQSVRVEIEGLGHIENRVISEPNNIYGG